MDQPDNASAADEALAVAAVGFDNNNNDDAAALPAHVLAANDNDDDDDDAHAVAANDQDQDDDNDDDDNADHDDQDDQDEDIFDSAESEQFCKEAMAILQQRLKFPSQIRDRSIVRFAKQFITNVKDDIHQMLTDTHMVEEGYKGLDNERDTEDEVETAIRCCPEVLTRRDDRFRLYPIRCLTFMWVDDDTKLVCNVKAVSFVPLLARLAIEFHSFDVIERGGLLAEDENEGHNILHALTYQSDSSFDAQHHEHVDTTFFAVLIRLRQTGLLMKDDIQQYNLVHTLCSNNSCLALRRFRFFTEWCPSSLITSGDRYGALPLHWCTIRMAGGSLQEFQLIFDALLCFYPRWKGMLALFQQDDNGRSSIEMACENFPRKSVMETVEQTILRYTGTTPSLNIGNALMMAAIDDTISLDGVFFLMRRQPDKMLSMLRCRHQGQITTGTQFSSSSSSDSSSNNRYYNLHSTSNGPANGRNKITDGIASNRNNDNKNIDNISNNESLLRKSTRKRKRN